MLIALLSKLAQPSVVNKYLYEKNNIFLENVFQLMLQVEITIADYSLSPIEIKLLNQISYLLLGFFKTVFPRQGVSNIVNHIYFDFTMFDESFPEGFDIDFQWSLEIFFRDVLGGDSKERKFGLNIFNLADEIDNDESLFLRHLPKHAKMKGVKFFYLQSSHMQKSYVENPVQVYVIKSMAFASDYDVTLKNAFFFTSMETAEKFMMLEKKFILQKNKAFIKKALLMGSFYIANVIVSEIKVTKSVVIPDYMKELPSRKRNLLSVITNVTDDVLEKNFNFEFVSIAPNYTEDKHIWFNSELTRLINETELVHEIGYNYKKEKYTSDRFIPANMHLFSMRSSQYENFLNSLYCCTNTDMNIRIKCNTSRFVDVNTNKTIIGIDIHVKSKAEMVGFFKGPDYIGVVQSLPISPVQFDTDCAIHHESLLSNMANYTMQHNIEDIEEQLLNNIKKKKNVDFIIGRLILNESIIVDTPDDVFRLNGKQNTTRIFKHTKLLTSLKILDRKVNERQEPNCSSEQFTFLFYLYNKVKDETSGKSIALFKETIRINFSDFNELEKIINYHL